MSEFSAGDINERGFLNGLERQGFNHDKCILELFGNSIDKGSKNILCEVINKSIYIIDDGIGMNKQQVLNAFSLHNENHTNDKSIGISGIGGKVSQVKLSNKTKVFIYTSDGNEYHKIIAPWNIIYEKGIYTNMIKIEKMNRSEINWFHSKLDQINNESIKTGTIIEFIYNDSLDNAIHKQFKDSYFPDKASIVYGRFETNIYLKNDEGKKLMPKYNYFCEEDDSKYILGKKIINIKLLKKFNENKIKYIWEEHGKLYEFPPKGKGFSKKPEEIKNKSLKNYTSIGEFKLTIGQRYDESVFDDNNPPTLDEIELRYSRDKLHLYTIYDKENLSMEAVTSIDCWEFIIDESLIRNNQRIGGITHKGDFCKSSLRGSALMYQKNFGVRAEISYITNGKQSNEIDKAMNIQQNKNQWQSDDLETPFKRIILHHKNKKGTEIYNHWVNISKKFHIKHELEVASEVDTEHELEVTSEIDTERESEDEPIHEPDHESDHEPEPDHEDVPKHEPPKSNCQDVTEHTRISMQKSELIKNIDTIRNYHQNNPNPNNPTNVKIHDTLFTIINNKFNPSEGKDPRFVSIYKKSFMNNNIKQLLEIYEHDITRRSDNEEIYGGAHMNDLYKSIFK